MARIKVIETPNCWWYGVEEQTVEHLYSRLSQMEETEKETSSKARKMCQMATPS